VEDRFPVNLGRRGLLLVFCVHPGDGARVGESRLDRLLVFQRNCRVARYDRSVVPYGLFAPALSPSLRELAPPLKEGRIELVTIGDELLLGFTIDSNAAHISRVLGEIGFEVVRRATVGDSAADIKSAVGDALARTGAVITTGGLGPTSDDLSKAAVAGLFGREMVLEEHARGATIIFSTHVMSHAEELCDHVTPEEHPKVGRVKDLGSSASLLVGVAALLVGCTIFIPHLVSL